MSKRKIITVSDKPGKGKDKPKSGLDPVIVQGIWGIVYASIGMLMLVAMLFYKDQPADSHILLGPLGTWMALGMFYIFGRITALAIPAALCYIGIAKLVNRPTRWKLLFFLSVVTLELCLLLAVNHMPILAAAIKDNSFWDTFWMTVNSRNSNFIGILMASGLIPVFGGRTFGPYFITAVLMAITVIVGLRIKPQAALAFAAKRFMRLMVWIKRAFVEVKAGIDESPPIREKPTPGDTPVTADKKSAADDKKSLPKKREKAAPAPPASTEHEPDSPVSTAIPSGDNVDTVHDVSPGNEELTPEEETKKRLDDELKEFRRKSKEPIKILTIETTEVEPVLDDAPLFIDESGEADGDPSDGPQAGRPDGGENGESDDFKVSELKKPSKPYVLPPPDILPDPPALSAMVNKEAIERNSEILEKTLANFGIEGAVVSVSPGPVVTRYEMELAPGVKVSRVVNLQDDISLAVGGQKIRIQAPIPGKAAIGIELPNEERQTIFFKNILTSDAFKKCTADIPFAIGTNISGAPYVTDIAKTPHLLIAGQTGAGKSVCMNALVCSMLMTKKPEELRLIMIDPKVVELACFADIPHLLAPVVTEPKEAVKALQWGVNEMERRYKLLGKSGSKKLETFNERVENGELAEILDEEDNKKLPFIVIIIDELADLMMTASKDIEGLIMRITQKARAAGIHLIVATQRPSVDIVTGKIKSNLPSRIAFRTVQAVDSRTILDRVGAEKLLDKGDMLFLRNGAPDIERFHGAFISEKEVDAIVREIRAQGVEMEVTIKSFNDVIEDGDGGNGDCGGNGERDSLFAEAARITVSIGQGSTSLLQRRMKIGFARAGRIMDELERAGIVGPSVGSKTREVLVSPAELEGML